jgi:hypothetical protein
MQRLLVRQSLCPVPCSQPVRRSWIKLLPLISVACCLLTACDTVDHRITQAITGTATIADPWDRLNDLNKRVADVLRNDGEQDCIIRDNFVEFSCTGDAGSAMNLVVNDLLEKSYSKHTADVLMLVYGSPDVKDWPYGDFRKRHVSEFLPFAEGLPATIENVSVLEAAGRIYREGKWVSRDNDRALILLAKAWALSPGQTQAAAELTSMYRDSNDFRNAYLWGLRCVDRCNLFYASLGSNGVDLLQKSLSPEAITEIQHVATDHTVIDLDTKDG